MCLTQAGLNSWVILTLVYKAQLWQTGVYLYLHTKPLPLSSICSHHLLKWRRLCIILRPRLQSKLQRCDWCCTWCCLATMMFMYHIERLSVSRVCELLYSILPGSPEFGGTNQIRVMQQWNIIEILVWNS